MTHRALFAKCGYLAMSACALQMRLSAGVCAQAGTPLHLKPQNTADVWQLGFKALLSAVLLLGIFAAALWGWRRWKRGHGIAASAGPAVQLESARRVSQKTTLLTVQWLGRRYLLAENAGATRLIDSRPLDGAPE